MMVAIGRRKYVRVTLYMILVLAFLGIVVPSHAAIPRLISYQGRLTDSAGMPLNGAYELTFRLYDTITAGTMLWEEIHSGVVIDKGLFSVNLGSATALNLFFDKPYYLEIKVNGEVMTPRQVMTAAGYAIRAERAEGIDKIMAPVFFVSITNDAIVPQGSIDRLVTENNDMSDILTTINAAESGKVLVLSAANTGKRVSVKEGGNIYLSDERGEFVMDHDTDRIVLISDGVSWFELCRSNNYAGAQFGVTIQTGTIASGGTIPLPAGYTQEQCKWTVSLNRIMTGGDQHATLYQNMTIGVDANRVVTAVENGGAGLNGATGIVNYMIIGSK